MIGIIKAKKAIASLVAILAAIAATVGGAFVRQATHADVPLNGYTIVVDAGHGGIDGGVVGSAGVKESDINLKMAKILQGCLERQGFSVVMTRKDADALSNIKRLDMQARKKIIVDANPAAVISLHVNRFSDASRRGAQVFYDDTGVGKDFAEAMQKAINENINAKYSSRDDYEAISGDLFITKCVKVPSIIIECGFISNAEDEKLLLSESYCKELCNLIASTLGDGLAV